MKPLFNLFKILSVIFKSFYYSIKILLKPEDIYSILKLGNLLTDTKAFSFCLERALQDPGAKTLIEERYSKGGFDMNSLKSAPNGSLGNELFKHLSTSNLSPYPLKIDPKSSDKIYLRERQREIHDVLHCVYGLGIDIKDEAKLNAIVMVQVYSPIATLIVSGSVIHMLFKSPSELPALMESIVEGFREGQHSKNIFSIKWDELMDQPLASVQKAIKAS